MFGKRDVGREFPLLENNLFYAEVPSNEVCLVRYSDTDGTRHFLQQLPLGAEKNTLIANEGAHKQDFTTAKDILASAIGIIANGAQ